MKVLFRVDGNGSSGLGHLFRCITIANEVRAQNPTSQIYFLSQNSPSVEKYCLANHFFLEKKPDGISEDAFLKDSVSKLNGAVLVIDTPYIYAAEFIQNLRQQIKILMMHFISEGCFHANVFVLPAAHMEEDIIHDARWKNGAVRFFEGKDFIVINEKIKNLGSTRTSASRGKFQIVVSTGGSDPEGIVLKLAQMLGGFREKEVHVTILEGEAFAYQKELNLFKTTLPINIEVLPYDASHWLHADLAICTFGITTYELMFLGIPTICIGHIPISAKRSAILAERYRATVDAGYYKNLSSNGFLSLVNNCIDSHTDREMLGQRARLVIDGQGAHRVSSIILGLADGT